MPRSSRTRASTRPSTCPTARSRTTTRCNWSCGVSSGTAIFGQINYTFSDTRSDSIGDTSQNRIEPFLDNNRPQLDAGHSLYHNAHVINANGVFELPFGEGKPWLNGGGFSDAVFGGWQLATIVKWQSGAPLSIRSARGTFNRTGRSGRQTAATSLTADQIKALFGVREANGNVYFIDPAVIGSDGRMVAPDSLSGTRLQRSGVFQPGRRRRR